MALIQSRTPPTRLARCHRRRDAAHGAARSSRQGPKRSSIHTSGACCSMNCARAAERESGKAGDRLTSDEAQSLRQSGTHRRSPDAWTVSTTKSMRLSPYTNARNIAAFAKSTADLSNGRKTGASVGTLMSPSAGGAANGQDTQKVGPPPSCRGCRA